MTKTIDEIAVLADRSVFNVRKFLKRLQIVGRREGGKAFRYAESDVAAILQAIGEAKHGRPEGATGGRVNVAKAKQMLTAGKTLKQVGKKFGVTRQGVQQAIKRVERQA